MRGVLILWFVSVLGGCAASQGARPIESAADAKREDVSPASSASLEQKQAQQQQRIAELEARISLLEAESRRTRGFVASAPVPTETVRIHPPPAAVSSSEEDDGTEADTARVPEVARPTRSSDRVPMLRLYGQPHAELPDLPTQNETLPVVPLPEERALAAASVAAPSSANEDSATVAYRNALRALREQRYDDAAAGFEGFVKSFPQHPLAGNALYWRGEAQYGKRDYQKAREAFDAVLAHFAQNEKVPDALVKLGLCLRRLGDEAQAQVCFRRVREKYPNTQAAAIALREGST